MQIVDMFGTAVQYQMTTKRKPWRKNLYENSDYEDNYTDPSFLKDLKTNLHVRFFTLGEAIQVLHTLTYAISTDTIFSMTFFVMVLNLVFCDYGLSVAMVSKAISLNAAIFGSICLASRLPTSYHAFVLLVESAITLAFSYCL
uniref:Uncharacterized protein n=2 Tax=Glossina TaxID=44049 RepID=A0A1A9VIS0_GLOAU